MTFGIDLGTTNSLIGYGDELYSGLVPSNVDIVKAEQVGREVVGPDIVSSYKINMSTESTGEIPIQCSSIILRTLADMATRRSGAVCEDVIISVPYYFTHIQREAVKEAAKRAGLNFKGLINEPTAAALYTCSNIRDLVIVYDLGGGTFDVSIVDSRVGGYNVIATDGMICGGDDLDQALVNTVFKDCRVPLRFQTKEFRKHLKTVMRLAKEQIQKQKTDVHVDLSQFEIGCDDYVLTEAKYIELVEDVFGQTLDMTQQLIDSNIGSQDKPRIVYVGGSSNCPYLKKMIKDTLDLEEIKSEVQPDYLVARGVAYYAKLFDQGKVDSFVNDVTKRLSVEDSAGRTIEIIKNNMTIPCKGTAFVHNTDKSDELRLRLYQGDSIMAAKNDYIGSLVYKFDQVMEPGEGYVEVGVSVDRDGVIVLSAKDIWGTEEQKIPLLLVKR